jgi:hypothetical protein
MTSSPPTDLVAPIDWVTENEPFTLLFDENGEGGWTNPVSSGNQYFQILEPGF